jgi:ribokinase
MVGSINMDLYLEMEKLPVEGETLFGKVYDYIPGGKGANQAVAAARLGADVTFAGRVGKDAHGERLRKLLVQDGINDEFLKTDFENSTGLAIIVLEDRGKNRIIVYSGANMAISLEDVGAALQKNYDAVMMQFEVPFDIMVETCRLAKNKNIPVILDAGPALAVPIEKLRGLEVISPNESETYAFTGVKVDSMGSAEAAALILQEKTNARYVVIKMGERGALLYHNGASRFFDALKVTAVDTTAAGDAFTAALTVSYVKTGDIEKAVRYANMVGAIAVTRHGAQPSMPNEGEVNEFEKQYRDLLINKNGG